MTPTGVHHRPEKMARELARIVSWPPPERLRKDCEVWCERGKHCAAVNRTPGGQPPLKPVLESRPFYRVQTDLMEGQPEGEAGERHVFTLICVATRYDFLRVCQPAKLSFWQFFYLALCSMQVLCSPFISPTMNSVTWRLRNSSDCLARRSYSQQPYVRSHRALSSEPTEKSAPSLQYCSMR